MWRTSLIKFIDNKMEIKCQILTLFLFPDKHIKRKNKQNQDLYAYHSISAVRKQ